VIPYLIQLAGGADLGDCMDEESAVHPELIAPEPAAAAPAVPPEVHNTRPIDPERCHAATRALCG
jgi:hypothetical protein